MRVLLNISIAIGLLWALLLPPTPASARVICGAFFPTQFGPAQRCDAGIPSQFLDVTAQIEPDTQLQSQWCWAASISGVFAYYGHPVSQQEIVQAAYGAVIDMPGSPQAIMASLNRPWIDGAGRAFQVRADLFTANWVTAAQESRLESTVDSRVAWPCHDRHCH